MNYVTELPAVSDRLQFSKASPQGFGDRHNSWAWSMLWWRGHLYVGTNRAFLATERAAISRALPWLKNMAFVKYPPDDPDIEYPPDPADLLLNAEIWRWTPEADSWERVYVSPVQVPIPDRPGKFVAADIGFREMAVFTEADGTEAMYVSGVNSKYFNGDVPPPRLLRTTDGTTFEALPQSPGTVLGSIQGSTLRTIVTYKGKFYVTAGKINGDGLLYEATNPELGDNAFRRVSPEGMWIFEMAVFNDWLYLGQRDSKGGYAVVKTDASGTPPYQFIPVVQRGAYLPQPSLSVISMYVFKDQLYVGTDRPAELIRINQDDSWEVVVGSPRKTPDGWKHPISGLDDGFCNWLNGHMWRMQEYNGRLYIGTMNMATPLRNIPEADDVLTHNFGFDLFVTDDGCHFTPITLQGFGDMFDFGLRTMAKTPYGLFLGTANSWYGTHIWRGTKQGEQEQMLSTLNGESVPKSKLEMTSNAPVLEAEIVGDKVILSWEKSDNIQEYRVWRAKLEDQRRIVDRNPFVRNILKVARKVLPMFKGAYLPPLPKVLWIPGPYAELAVTDQDIFEVKIGSDDHYLYYVESLAPDGTLVESSNMVRVPSLSSVTTFASLMSSVDGVRLRRTPVGRNNLDALEVTVVDAWTALCADHPGQARELLQGLLQRYANGHVGINAADYADLQYKLRKVCRRLKLCELGFIAKDTV